MVKGSEIRDLSDDELERRLEETREELFNLRFQHATGQLDNYQLLRRLRRDVARIRTIARERELTLQGEASEEGASTG